ncbi:protein kinase domain-containing protein [Planctomicrobium sp. SH668]|uniref:protein kinase domain-containing protein n=1 Tax=Planctomicrobium sp. SH668 TaxID=3448126 RepID=UPI003F5B3A99
MDRSKQPDSTSSQFDNTPVQGQNEQDESRKQSLRQGAIPMSVGGYEVLKNIGEGSYGTVWLGRERKTGKQVAIKFFTTRRGLDWTLLTREVEKLAVLDASRDVVRLLDVGVDHDPPYFVMEYLPHRSVADLLTTGPISIQQSLSITAAVARALVHAHSAGILHCDIKPGNVLLDRGDDARLGDFGQSRLASDQSSAFGTFYYMPPEQAVRNAVPDVRWDVYALGALLYNMLTGVPPYRTDESEARLKEAKSLDERLEIYQSIIEESPAPSEHREISGVDKALIELIDRCLQKNPIDRIPNPQVVLDLLERREVNRARRPLIWLGFLGPILFLVTLFWLGNRVIHVAVGQAENHLSMRALSGDMATTRLLAVSLQLDLSDRQSELERLARRLAAPESTPHFMGLRSDYVDILDRWRADNEKRLDQQHRTIDESFFLTDANGIQIYRAPWKESIGQSFSYRDYFHGLGRELGINDDVSQIQPRQKSGISTPFRSTNTNDYMVAIAAPVWDSENTKVIGVLARTIHISDLLKQWEERIAGHSDQHTHVEDHDRILSLIDMREDPPLILDHPSLNPRVQNATPVPAGTDRTSSSFQLSADTELELNQAIRDGKGIAKFKDPFAEINPHYAGEWLAAVAKLPDIDWITIVQERKDDAIRPMEDLYWIFLRYALALLAIFGVMLSVLWWLVQRVIRSP